MSNDNQMLTSKQQRYDRQLRLWHEHGQQRLDESHVLLINADATGSEVLKNLVLPGIGQFTVMDHELVTQLDLASNFYVDHESIGSPRADTVCRRLMELNEDVIGHSVIPTDGTYKKLLEDVDYFKQFTLVIASNLPLDVLIALSESCNANRQPLVVVYTCGFYGYVRLQLPEHCVIEAHPENAIDLRLADPWSELRALAAEVDLQNKDSMYKSHIPYPLLLLSYQRVWNEHHDTQLCRRDLDDFKKFMLSDAPQDDSENYHEACRNAYRLFQQQQKLPSNLEQLFAVDTQLTSDSEDFWFLLEALKTFCKSSNDSLPLIGSLPDMKADTEQYIQLQRVYKAKATKDCSLMQQNVDKLTQQHGKSSISAELVQRFCKNAQFIRVNQYSTIADEFKSLQLNIDKHLEDADAIYIALRAALQFGLINGRMPGDGVEDIWDLDVQQLQSITQELLQQRVLTNQLLKTLYEFARAGNAQVHSTCAYIGGLASQECLKIMTKQYIPVNNTIIYDGMKSLPSIRKYK
ncbi:hypothetical protein MIR68_002754 [Amoeboaphelidium protococcarum]|nr:hypothetical protein MIR68_002754 [Amoeboaphelidium protococcarum]